MRRLVLLLFICCFNSVIFAQNTAELKIDLKRTLEEFESCLTMLNDDEYPSSPLQIADTFGASNYFKLNGVYANFADFLNDYKYKHLQQKMINHKIEIDERSVRKLENSHEDKRWIFRAVIKRSNTERVDYLILDEDVEMVVLWNGKNKNLSILEIRHLSPAMIVSYPIRSKEYDFRSSGNQLLPATGGKWDFQITSKCRDVKVYPNTNIREEGPWADVKYSIIKKSSNLRGKVNIDYYGIKGEESIRGNNTKNDIFYNILLQQDNSGKELECRIIQKHYETFYEKAFDYNEDCPTAQIEGYYNTKNRMYGLSYMHSLENRLYVGVIVAFNSDNFKGMTSWFKSLISLTTDMDVNIDINNAHNSNGYIISHEHVIPNKTNFSGLMDPYEVAKYYISKSLYMVQGGVSVFDWLRTDIGIGVMRERNLYHMEEAYAIDIYKYEKTISSLPDIEDVLVYSPYYSNYYFKDKPKAYFTIRPALNISVPLDSDNMNFLSLGGGYSFVINGNSSFDFSLGYGWWF